MNVNVSTKDAYGLFLTICKTIVNVGLLLAFVALVLALFGVRVPYVRILGASDLAYLCGAWWLFCNVK